MFTINPQNNIEKSYLYTYMKQEKMYKLLNSSNGSSAMPALNFSSVGNVEISYSNIDEQKQIANIFTNIDNLITLHQRK
jgi:type I restriction enzyme S subunit